MVAPLGGFTDSWNRWTCWDVLLQAVIADEPSRVPNLSGPQKIIQDFLEEIAIFQRILVVQIILKHTWWAQKSVIYIYMWRHESYK